MTEMNRRIQYWWGDANRDGSKPKVKWWAGPVVLLIARVIPIQVGNWMLSPTRMWHRRQMLNRCRHYFDGT